MANGVSAYSVQQTLIKLGYQVQSTETFDSQTVDAIRYFQNNYYPQAPVPGVMDDGTWNAMVAELNKRSGPLKYFLETHVGLLVGGAVAVGAGIFLLVRGRRA